MPSLKQIKRPKILLIAAPIAIIVGILVVISNQPPDSFSRAQVSTGLNLSGQTKAIVTEFFLDHDQFPPDNDSAGLPPAKDIQGKYVSSVRVGAGDVVITFGNDANSDIHGKTLILRPETIDRSIRWACFSPDIEIRNLPATCRPRSNNN